MEEKANQLSERLLDFGVEIVSLTIKLRKSETGKHIADQLLRSGTSVGANYEEACGAQSRADFIHKLQIVLKEMRESIYWLKLVQRAKLMEDPLLKDLTSEAAELSNIIAKSVITAKNNR